MEIARFEKRHIPGLLAALPPRTYDELYELALGDPERLIAKGLERAAYSFCGLEYGVPIAGGATVGGAASGQIWMVASSPAVERHRKWFLRESRRVLGEAMTHHHRLVCGVEVSWRKSLRWLEWLGFSPYGEDRIVMGRTVRFFEKTR